MAGQEEIAVAQAARALLATASGHKKAAAFHRRECRKAMQGLAELRERCRAAGIGLEVA